MIQLEDIFIVVLKEYIDDLRSLKLPKGKFIAKYMEQLNKVDKSNAFKFKNPQVIAEGKDPKNNWIDYILELSDGEYDSFKEALFSE
jgi:hypothetical protein